MISPDFTSFTVQSLLTEFLRSVQYQVSISKRSCLRERKHYHNQETSRVFKDNRQNPEVHRDNCVDKPQDIFQEACKSKILRELLHAYLPRWISINFDVHPRCDCYQSIRPSCEGSIANLHNMIARSFLHRRNIYEIEIQANSQEQSR